MGSFWARTSLNEGHRTVSIRASLQTDSQFKWSKGACRHFIDAANVLWYQPWYDWLNRWLLTSVVKNKYLTDLYKTWLTTLRELCKSWFSDFPQVPLSCPDCFALRILVVRTRQIFSVRAGSQFAGYISAYIKLFLSVCSHKAGSEINFFRQAPFFFSSHMQKFGGQKC